MATSATAHTRTAHPKATNGAARSSAHKSNHEHISGGFERRHLDARALLAREALTPEQDHVRALMAEVDDATRPSLLSEMGITLDDEFLARARAHIDSVIHAGRVRADAILASWLPGPYVMTIDPNANTITFVLNPGPTGVVLHEPAVRVCPHCGGRGDTKAEAEKLRRRRIARRTRPAPLARCCRQGELWA